MSSPPTAPVMMWFRDDLRLADNPALAAAIATGAPVLCLYIHDDGGSGMRRLGGAARWWLHGALDDLDKTWPRAARASISPKARQKTSSTRSSHASRRAACSGTAATDRRNASSKSRIKAALKARDIAAESFNGSLLREPWEVTTRRRHAVFGVHGLLARRMRRTGCAAAGAGKNPCGDGARRFAPAQRCACSHSSLRRPDRAQGLRSVDARRDRRADPASTFLDADCAGYATGATAPIWRRHRGLSPYLRFGNISPRQVWHAVEARRQAEPGRAPGARTTARNSSPNSAGGSSPSHLLFHHPALATREFQQRIRRHAVARDRRRLCAAWQRGRTGYPIVDAGMRELWRRAGCTIACA